MIAQRRNRDLEHAEAKEQIAAEAALRHHFGQVAVGRGDDARVELSRLFAPDRAHLLVLDRVQKLGLHLHRQLADFVEKERSLVGREEQSPARLVGARECASRMTEELAFHQLFRNGAAIHGDERLLAAQALLVDGAGQYPFPCAALPDDQHRAVGRRNLLGEALHVLHRGRLEPEQRRVFLADGLAQRLVLVAQSAHGLDARETVEELLVAHRLDHVIEGARAQRFHRRFHRGDRRHHDEDRVDARCAGPAQHADAVAVGHLDVAKRHVEVALRQHGDGFLRARRRLDRIPGLLQHPRKDLPQHRLVVDYQDVRGDLHGSGQAPPAAVARE